MDVKKCQSIEEVRNEIDAIDSQIVDLIGKRSKYVKQAATFKKSVEDVKSEDRVKEVISKTKTKAVENGLSPFMVEELFKGLIDKMVAFEIEEFQNTKAF
ncbi:MAG: chorismate mutase [Campylobacterales bacterium]|nr:chorismate mutase [Campylobacterales bacterium]